MDWKIIRLELGPTQGFPKGSASRAFLLRAPIDEVGEIDAKAVASNPTEAMVRRFWASERDESGRLERMNGSWVFRPGEGDRSRAYSIAAGPFRPNARILIRQPDGTELPFRVVTVRKVGTASA